MTTTLDQKSSLGLLEGITSLADVASFKNNVQAFANALGYQYFAVSGVTERPTGGYSFRHVECIPETFQNDFVDVEKGQVDPVMQHCKTSFVPIVWDQGTYVAAGKGEAWEEMASHGMVSGVAVALHAPHGRHVLFGFDRSEPAPVSDTERQNVLAHLQLFAAYSVEPALDLLTDGPGRESEVVLTDREIECLKWTMAGKTAKEISMILGISDSWTTKVLVGVSQKLGCVNKQQAAAKVLRLGLLR